MRIISRTAQPFAPVIAHQNGPSKKFHEMAFITVAPQYVAQPNVGLIALGKPVPPYSKLWLTLVHGKDDAVDSMQDNGVRFAPLERQGGMLFVLDVAYNDNFDLRDHH